MYVCIGNLDFLSLNCYHGKFLKLSSFLLCRVPGVEFDTLVKFDSSLSKVYYNTVDGSSL